MEHVVVECPQCHTRGTAPRAAVGRAMTCPKCRMSFVLQAAHVQPGAPPGEEHGQQDADNSAPAATKRCPFCAEDIRAQATFCKHCKSPLPESDSTSAEAPQPTPEREAPVPDAAPPQPIWQRPWAIVAGVILLILVVSMFSHDYDEATTATGSDAVSLEEFEASALEVSVDALVRRTEHFQGKRVALFGRALGVNPQGKTVVFHLTEDVFGLGLWEPNSAVRIVYEYQQDDTRILDNDFVSVLGVVRGRDEPWVIVDAHFVEFGLGALHSE